MSVEILTPEVPISDAVRRNVEALAAAIGRWDDRFGINHKTQLKVVDGEGPDEDAYGAIDFKDDEGYYSGMFIDVTGVEAMTEADLEQAAASLAVSSVAEPTAERDPARYRGRATIDCISTTLVKGFIGIENGGRMPPRRRNQDPPIGLRS